MNQTIVWKTIPFFSTLLYYVYLRKNEKELKGLST